MKLKPRCTLYQMLGIGATVGALLCGRPALSEYKPSVYGSPEKAIEALGDFESDNGTLKILSKAPLHIQLSPQVVEGDREDVIRVQTRKALLYGIYRTFIHTKVNEIKVTALPIDLITDEPRNEFKETIAISRAKALSAAQKILGVKSFEELVRGDAAPGIFKDSWSTVFEKGYFETGNPGVNKFIEELKK